MNFLFLMSFLFMVVYVYAFIKMKNYLIVLPIFYSIVNIYSLLGLYYFDFAKIVPFDLYKGITYDDIYNTSIIYIIASLSFFVGSLCKKGNKSDFFSTISKKILMIPDIYKLLIVSITILSLTFGYGFEAIISRYGYIDMAVDRNKTLLIVYMLTLPISSFLLPFVKNKTISLCAFFIVFLLIFGTTARMLLLLPVFYFIGDLVKNRKISLIKVTICIIVVLFIFTFTLEFRNNYKQGIINNLDYLLNNGLGTEYLNLGFNYILSFSFLVLSNVTKYFNGNLEATLISINPLPSSMLDINYMLSHQSLNSNSPFSAISILALEGYSIVCLYYFIASLVFGFISNYFIKKKNPLLLIIMVLFFMFTFFSIQYNLRGATRFLYYTIMIFVVYNIYYVIKAGVFIKIGRK